MRAHGLALPNICKEIRNQQDECGIGDNYKKLPSGSHPVCEQDAKYLAVFSNRF
jgi:hypothetical protein